MNQRSAPGTGPEGPAVAGVVGRHLGASEEPGASGDAPDRQSMGPTRKVRELTVAAVGLAGGLALLVLGGNIELRVNVGGIDPRWWPQVLGASAVVLAVALFAQTLTRPVRESGNEPASRAGAVRVVASLALVAGYVVAWQHVDFRICTVALLIALAVLYGARGIVALVIYPVAVTGLIYVLFDVGLRVPL
ncbi:tripartite tricarboxylate transporter TctB family protein [Phytoactinopolyspora mesophila]|uniref:Tripartite tricarboxylate transporter TctB family protein n=1 Tax=Phytoactinopolyspora mesophila TaxID=2650750 RepID=A0A7K3MDD5_9ACTN|nr:tripartite tricarboxylate transporter TctB family protein [Phytoactinopolyspora mesophila]NDL61067.1 tripartite tricarboxylate transporter TctB family protein [Phytoactinopolyspora mesophila]